MFLGAPYLSVYLLVQAWVGDDVAALSRPERAGTCAEAGRQRTLWAATITSAARAATTSSSRAIPSGPMI